MENFEKYFIGVLKKYAVFEGRARRKEYWMFILYNTIIQIILYFIDQQGVISSLYALIVFIPSIAVAVRRLHDTDRSGWWMLLWFIPVIGWIILLVFLIRDSKPGRNQYGANPKGPMASQPDPMDEIPPLREL